MLPLTLLQSAQAHPMLVELKNGDTYNGHLVNCDTWMNLNLREVICTSKDGDQFWRIPECYIRGDTIKYIRVPNEVMDKAQTEELSKRELYANRGRGRGGRGGVGGRGRGRGDNNRHRGRGDGDNNSNSHRGGRGGRGGRGSRGGRGHRGGHNNSSHQSSETTT